MLRLRLLPMFMAAIALAAPLFAQNDKQVLGDAVLTPSEIANGATVLYLIRFQNTGHDTAQQVTIRDTLDPRLDPGTFTMLSASHDYQLLGEGGSLIRWYFEDIQLPDSASGGPQLRRLHFVLGAAAAICCARTDYRQSGLHHV